MKPLVIKWPGVECSAACADERRMSACAMCFVHLLFDSLGRPFRAASYTMEPGAGTPLPRRKGCEPMTEKPQRLDKLLAGQGTLSRSQARDLVRSGAVCVDGLPVRLADSKVPPGAVVTVHGRPLQLQPYVYLMMNKPAGVVSASRDGRTKTVVELVPPYLARKGLFPAGRLDKDTTGFVLLTDDGQLAHRLLAPRNHIPKTYIATLDSPVTPRMAPAFAKGVVLADGSRCLPAQLTALGSHTAQVVLRQGMYHQVKRMFAALGAKVTALERVAIGGLALDPALPPGHCRPLTLQELLLLQNRGEQPPESGNDCK